MVKRWIIRIDEEKCSSCGLCIPGCAEVPCRWWTARPGWCGSSVTGWVLVLATVPDALTLEERKLRPSIRIGCCLPPGAKRQGEQDCTWETGIKLDGHGDAAPG